MSSVQAVLRGQAGDSATGDRAAGDPVALAELIGRLSQRTRPYRPQPPGSHWPEYALVPAAALARMVLPQDWG